MKRNRRTFWTCTILAGVIVWSTGLLCLRLLAYAEAMYGNWGFDGPVSLRGQALPGAPLRGRNLRKTDKDVFGSRHDAVSILSMPAGHRK